MISSLKVTFTTTLFLIFSLCAEGPLLKQEDIQSIMGDIFRQHVDKKEVSASIFRHAINSFIEDADPDKSYLLHSEVAPFTEMSDSALDLVFQKYKMQDYTFFLQINEMIQKGLLRAEMSRKRDAQRYTRWIEETLNGAKPAPYDFEAWATSLNELTARQESLFKLFVENRIHRYGRARVSGQKEEVFKVYQEDLSKKENPYLYLNANGMALPIDQQQNLFTLHILKALASSLDSHTKIYDPTEAKDMRARLERDNPDELKVTSEQFGNGVIASIKLDAFYQNNKGISSEKDVKEAIEKLEAQNLKGLILDLRDNRGGFLTQAVKVAGLFITNGIVVISKYSSGDERIYRDTDGKTSYKGPLVILVSKMTASAAEIVAQALQDYGVALVVGDEHTYGKGTIQSQTVTDGLGASSYFKVTVGKYYTVSGKTPQLEGVRSDVVVPGPYSFIQIGEVFLKDTLSRDRIAAEFADNLSDVDPNLKSWYLKYYIPTLQSPVSEWDLYHDKLRANSSYRLNNNQSYQMFLREQPTAFRENDDLQQKEAFNILRDMIYFESKDNRAKQQKSIEFK